MKYTATAMQLVPKEAPHPKFVAFKDVFEHMNEIHNSISRRAFQIFENNGRRFNHDLEDWLKAEAQVLHPAPVNISESDQALTIHVEVPGFSAEEIAISVEPWRLTVSGKRQCKEDHNTGKTVYCEQCAHEIFRAVNLPVEVDAAKVTVMLRDGVLELGLPKAASARVEPKVA